MTKFYTLRHCKLLHRINKSVAETTKLVFRVENIVGKMRTCWLPAFSDFAIRFSKGPAFPYFPAMFSKGLFLMVIKT